MLSGGPEALFRHGLGEYGRLITLILQIRFFT